MEYLHRPSQMSYHNLCKNIQPPKGIGITLGLGLKFCIQPNTPPPNLNKSYIRFVQDVRKRYIFAGIKQPETPKKIYTKSEWTPDKTEDPIEQRLMKFISQIQQYKKVINDSKRKSTNLTTLQQQHLKMLKNNTSYIILMADKNLGPCIMERREYIKSILREHLEQKETYTNLRQHEGQERLMKAMLRGSCNWQKSSLRLASSDKQNSSHSSYEYEKFG